MTQDKQEDNRHGNVDTDECWIYAGSTSNGYGNLRVDSGTKRKSYRVHRLTYERFIGDIPDGLVLDHLCEVTQCINPDHLEAVTQKENVMRSQGLTAINARKTVCHKGHPLTPDNLTYDYRGTRRCTVCNRERRMKAYFKTKGVLNAA